MGQQLVMRLVVQWAYVRYSKTRIYICSLIFLGLFIGVLTLPTGFPWLCCLTFIYVSTYFFRVVNKIFIDIHPSRNFLIGMDSNLFEAFMLCYYNDKRTYNVRSTANRLKRGFHTSTKVAGNVPTVMIDVPSATGPNDITGNLVAEIAAFDPDMAIRQPRR